MPVAFHELHCEFGLKGGFKVGVAPELPGEICTGIIKTPMPVVDMSAVESFKGLESPAPPTRGDVAGSGLPVDMEFSNVMGDVAVFAENLGEADFIRGEHEVVADHTGLVGMTSGKDIGAIRRADRVGGVGAGAVDPLGGEGVKVRGVYAGIIGNAERAAPPLVVEDEKDVRFIRQNGTIEYILPVLSKRKKAKSGGGGEKVRIDSPNERD